MQERAFMRGHKGYSLVEVMVVLGILAILAVLAVPNLFKNGPKQRLLSAASDVRGAINLARMAAIKENATAVIQFNTSAPGFTVFMDSNNNGSKDAGETLLRSGSFKSDINVTTGFSGNKVSFDGRGMASAAADVTLQNASAGTKTIQVTVTGSSRMQ
jgi:type IV fimbrial biogenesis protein FimT